jgi:ABC-2 type transport system permease protein
VSKLRLIVATEYLLRVRTRSFLLSTILAPLFMLALLLGPALLMDRAGESDRRVMVVDQSGQDLFGALQQEIGDPQAGGEGRTRLVRYRGDASLEEIRADVARQVEAGEFDGLLVLPSDFAGTGQASFYGGDASGALWTEGLERALGRVLIRSRLESLGLGAESLDQVVAQARLKTEHIRGEKADEAGLEVRLIVSFILVFLLYMMILGYGIQAMNGIIEDKASRVVEVMLSTVRPTTLMAGKILSSALVGLTQFAVWGVVAVGVMGRGLVETPLPLDLSFLSWDLWLSFTCFFLLGFLLFSSIYAAVGALCTSVQDAQQFQTPITLLVVVPIVLAQVVARDPDSALSFWLSLVPFFTPILMFTRVSMGSPAAWEVVLSLVVLAGTVVLMARLSGKLFRLAILSFGKAPGWRQVWGMLRAPE